MTDPGVTRFISLGAWEDSGHRYISALLGASEGRPTAVAAVQVPRPTHTDAHVVVFGKEEALPLPTRRPILTACSAACSDRYAFSTQALPAAVTRTPRPRRSTTGVPSSFSSDAI
jgi:hypothetical protein